MTREKCPAYGQQCLKCQGWNHFAVKCTKKTPGINRVASDAASVQYSDTDSDPDGTVGAVMGEVAAVTPLHKARMRIQGKDIKFLLDSGASVSLLSTHHVDVSKVNLSQTGKTLRMWNGSTQASMGTACIKVFNPKTGKSQSVDFEIVPEKLTPVLGCTAVQQMGLIRMETGNYDRVANVAQSQKTKEDYINAYNTVFSRPVGQLEGHVKLYVDDNIKPTVLPARRVPVAMQQALKDELDRLQDLKIISPVTTPTNWVSQMVSVRKRDTSLRICIDPTPLNNALKRERYQMKTFEDILPELANAKVFSKCDLHHGYWHCVLDDKSSELTTFQSPIGTRYKWNRLPFGLSVSSEIFQRKLNETLDQLDGVHVIADDVIITGVGDNMSDATRNHDCRFHEFLE